VKKFKAVRVNSPDGEAHYILPESLIFDRPEHSKDFDEVEIKKITKKDASKLLLITHE
jgi:hypothetical protein